MLWQALELVPSYFCQLSDTKWRKKLRIEKFSVTYYQVNMLKI